MVAFFLRGMFQQYAAHSKKPPEGGFAVYRFPKETMVGDHGLEPWTR